MSLLRSFPPRKAMFVVFFVLDERIKKIVSRYEFFSWLFALDLLYYPLKKVGPPPGSFESPEGGFRR